MKIKWLKNKDGAKLLDITQAVTSVSWGGSVSEAARTADISVINAPDDKNVKSLKLNIGAGDTIKLYENGDMIFLGEVQASKKTSETGTVTYTCYDLLNHLLRSTGVYNFKNTTAEKITKKVCTDLGIKTGFIAATNTPIKKMGETWGFSQLWDKTWENPNLIKIPETPYKIRFYRQYNFIVFRFSQVSTFFSLCSCKTSFCWWQIIFFSRLPSA